MALAHVCLGCGFDLARQRPRKELHYGLPMIVCPRCAAPSVRRKHPLMVRWRQFRRVDWAVSILVAKLLVAVAIAAATAFTILLSLLMAINWPPPKAELDVVRNFAVWAVIVLPLIIGIWITAGLNHLTRRRAWLGWAAVLSMVVLLIAALLASGSERKHFEPGTVEDVRSFAYWLPMFFTLGMTMLGAMMVLSAMGVPAGQLLLRLSAFNRKLRWRRRRRKFRKVRTAA
jgi:hypothetical protein